MDEYAYVFEGTAGVLYLLVGLRLWRLGQHRGEIAARLIGGTFLLWGVSYLLYNVPIAAGRPSLLAAFFFAGRSVYDAGAICIGRFTQRVFRPDVHWARAGLLGCALLLAVGVLGSAIAGDPEGIDVLGNPWFWVEWVGMTLPFLWMTTESWLAYRAARRRKRLGLCDALACHRFLLWALTGVCLVASNVASLIQSLEYERQAQFTLAMDAWVGASEIFTIGVIWLVFFTPNWYRRLLEQAPQASGSARAA